MRTTAIDARHRAVEAGGPAVEIAAGDSLFAAAESSASKGRVSEAVVQLTTATLVWVAAERTARERAVALGPAQRVEPSPAAPPRAEPALEPAVPRPVDPRVEIERVIGDYARALESGDVAVVRRAYPGLTAAQQRGWEQFFKTVRNLKANLRVVQLDARGKVADATINGTYEYQNTSTGRSERQPVTFRVSLEQVAAGWRIASIR
ncbi:MAG: hypothetical protein HY560_09310 [Gemmatimonadetes bacterium]|nr:hypothetical protein [Gemmatimonadota bacterium]